MFENLNIFRTAHAMAVHAGTRQTILARNMANADTPGYTARDLPPFAEIVGGSPSDFGLRASRPGHMGTDGGRFSSNIIDRADERDPNGNSVSLETEMLHAVETRRQHDRALAIYKSSLTVLRAAIGKA